MSTETTTSQPAVPEWVEHHTLGGLWEVRVLVSYIRALRDNDLHPARLAKVCHNSSVYSTSQQQGRYQMDVDCESCV